MVSSDEQAEAESGSEPEPTSSLSHANADEERRGETADARSAVRALSAARHTTTQLVSTGEPINDDDDDDDVLIRSEIRMSGNPAREVTESLEGADLQATSRVDQTREEEPTGGLDSTMADKMDGSLPHDDGMKDLRQKLHEIRTMAASTEEQARRMHLLMMQEYIAHKAVDTPSPTTLPTHHHQPEHEHELHASTDVSPLAPPIDPANPYNIHPADLIPSFSPLPPHPPNADGSTAEDDSDPTTTSTTTSTPTLGCRHYKRNVKVQCFDCHLWFPCRHCHDEAALTRLPFPHMLQRKKTQHMLCLFCSTPQPAGEVCIACGQYAAWYYCAKCKLWDNDSNKRIYHCDACGICRVGEGLGKDYVHCLRCNVCISISTSAAHPCVERATEGDCPLCLVRLFESQTPVVSLPCGHYMHGECYRDLMAVTYKCPVCSKSAVNMELQWRKLDDEIRAQPMPEDEDEEEPDEEVVAEVQGLLPAASTTNTTSNTSSTEEPQSSALELAPPPTAGAATSIPRRPRTVFIGCNDCGSRSWTDFHWLGLKCHLCDSYNTTQMPPSFGRETDAQRLARQHHQHYHRQHDFTGNAVLRDAGIGREEGDDGDDERERNEGEDGDLQRVDTALDVPTSPSQHPAISSTNTRTTGTSPPDPTASSSTARNRYFVQEPTPALQGIRSASSISTPTLSSLPNLNLPELPRLPRMMMPHLLPRPSLPHIHFGRSATHSHFRRPPPDAFFGRSTAYPFLGRSAAYTDIWRLAHFCGSDGFRGLDWSAPPHV